MQITEQTATLPKKKSVLDFLFGRRFSSDEDVKEQIRSSTGVPVFGLDALSSAAYGPEAALTCVIGGCARPLSSYRGQVRLLGLQNWQSFSKAPLKKAVHFGKALAPEALLDRRSLTHAR